MLRAKLTRLLGRNLLWSTAIYVRDEEFGPGQPLGNPHVVFNTKTLWRPMGGHVHTRADPFLFVGGTELFLFVEAQATNAPGRIEAYKTSDLRQWTHLGEILREPHHLSYPVVFQAGSEIYMLPESSESGAVRLYRFTGFPFSPQPVRELLAGSFVDTSPVKVDGTWYFFTTSERGLEIYHTDDLLRGVLQAHPANPITDDPRYRRCGGIPIWWRGSLYRLAQDCSGRYGGNLNLLRINTLSKTAYGESLAQEGLFDRSQGWNAQGGHHMSLASFMGRTVVAVDGQQYDFHHQKVIGLLRRLRKRR